MILMWTVGWVGVRGWRGGGQVSRGYGESLRGRERGGKEEIKRADLPALVGNTCSFTSEGEESGGTLRDS